MRRNTTMLLVALAILPAACALDNEDGLTETDDTESSEGGVAGALTAPVFETAHPRIYLVRNKTRLASALSGPAGQRFRTMVNAQMNGSDYWDFRQWYAALLGQLTGNAGYCTYAVSEIDDFVSAEEARIASGSNPEVSLDSYLEVGPKIGDAMMTYDWCYATLTAGQRSRWTAFAAQAVWNVWHPAQARWGARTVPWSGWSVDNPSNNYYYSFLTATMMFGLAAHGEHPDAAGWLDYFHDTKILGQLVPTFTADLEGGGSREGTGYGVAMKNLFHIYDMWKGSTGEDLSSTSGHARDSLLQMIHATVPTLDRIAPIGDHSRDSTAALFDYHRDYVETLAALYPNDPLVPRAKTFLQQSSVPTMEMSFNLVYDFLYDMRNVTAQPLDGLGRVFRSPGNGVIFARSGWDQHATWLNVIAGPYTESHAHRDQGSLMLFKDDWLAYDAVVESHSGIRQEEKLHNLVRIDRNGQTLRQRAGTESEVISLQQGPGWLHIAVDLTPAYDGDPAIDRVEREIVYIEPDVVVVYDRVTTSADTQQVWQLNSPRQPTVSGARADFPGANAMRVQRILPETATSGVHSWAAEDGEFSGGFRLDEAASGGARRWLHVVSLGGAATNIAKMTLPLRDGVVVYTATGRWTVRFHPDRVDSVLTRTHLNSRTVYSLRPNVVDMPE